MLALRKMALGVMPKRTGTAPTPALLGAPLFYVWCRPAGIAGNSLWHRLLRTGCQRRGLWVTLYFLKTCVS